MKFFSKKKRLLLAVCALVSAIWFSVKYFTQTPLPPMPDVWVKTLKVQPSTQPLQIHTVGTIFARSVEITPEVAGHIKQIFFQDGSVVKSGDPLIYLDDAIYASKYASARARLGYSQSDFGRKSLLAKRGAIAKQAIDQADADFKEKSADADETAVMLKMMHLVAPFDGVLGKCKVNIGEYVNVGQSLVTLTDTKHLRVEFNVSEQYLPLLKLGQSVIIKALAYPRKKFSGRVTFISPTVTLENRSVYLYADVDNDDNLLAPGMFVNVDHLLGRQKNVLVIPARSLVPMLDGVQVYKVVDGKALAVNVTTGQRMQEMIEIKDGLTMGDDVITDGQLKVRSGMPIKIEEANKTNPLPLKIKT